MEARDRQRRLLSYVLSVPQRVDRYLEASCWRRWLWAAISFSTGYYSGTAMGRVAWWQAGNSPRYEAV